MRKVLFCLAIILAFSLCAVGQSPSQKNAALNSQAMAALDKMGAYLRTLSTFEVNADVTSDDVLEDGQTVQTNRAIHLLAAKPNRLFVEITSDEMERNYFYNGKDFTIYGKLVDYYATVPAPPTTYELIDELQKKFAIELPLVDLFLWGSDESSSADKLTSAIDLGPSSVNGTTCEQYAFRQSGLDWQIWIQQGDYPLPRKLVLVTTDDESRPRFTETLTWNLAPSFNEAAFTFDPPASAHKIQIAELSEPAGNETKPIQGGAK